MKNKLFVSLSFAVLAFIIPASAQNNTFKLANTLNGSGTANPAEVVTADINGDGKVDWAGAANVYTNNGKGVFTAIQFSSFNIRSNGFVVMDANRDGRLDWVGLTNLQTVPFTESIVVYTNASPTFGSSLVMGLYSSTTNVGAELTNNSSQSVAQGALVNAGDVFGNGRANLFYYNPVSNSVALFTNNGAGTFGSNTSFGLKMGLPVTADVNRDGKMDFISPWASNNIVYVFTNNGSGIYGSNAALNVRLASSVYPVDVNGDGWVDLVIGATTNNLAGQTTNTVSIWTNNGSGTFGSNTSFTVGSLSQRVTDIKAAPVFGDGNLAMVFAVSDVPHSAGYLMVYTNNGAGSFGSNFTTATVGSSVSPVSVAVADLAGRGNLDLISANYGNGSGTVTIFTNTGNGMQSGSFRSNSTPVVGTNDYFVLAADLYRTGQAQLVVPGIGSTPTLLVLTNNGSGGFGSNAVVSGFTAPNSSLQSAPIAADVFGNGSQALIVGIRTISGIGFLTILTNNGAGVFGTNTSVGTGNGGFLPNQIASADVNGDGKLDLIANCQNSSGSAWNLIVLTNNGAGGFGTNVTLTLSGFSKLVVADVNNDGRPDLITAMLINQFLQSQMTVFTNISATGVGPLYSSSPPAAATYQITTGALPTALVAADVNGDGRPDMIIANNNVPGTLSVMTNSGFNNGNNSYTFGLNSSPVVGTYPHSLAAADVDGNGKVDLISANWGQPTNTAPDAHGPLGYGTLSVLTNNGTGVFTNPATFSTGKGPTDVLALDVNGDGRVDLIAANYTSNTNSSSGPTFFGTGNTLSILLNTSNFVNTIVLQSAPTASDIIYGQSLSAVIFTGGVVTNEAGGAVDGTFAFTNGVPVAGTANRPVTFSATPPTDYQPITFNVSSTVSQLVTIIKGKRAYDGTTNVMFANFSVSNKVGSDNVTIAAGSVGMDTANVGTNAITSTSGLALGGSTAVNYSLAGMSGSIIITNAVNVPVLTSSQNPSGYGSSVNFTATLPAYATGTIQFLTNNFLFDTEGLTSGSAGSVATTGLPLGYTPIAAVYSGDANNRPTTNTLNQLVAPAQFNAVILGTDGLVMSGSLGVSNETYWILASTNLTLPVSQWTPVLTNQFDASGNFNVTNPVDAGSPQKFYRLQSQ